jgi:hypothetical protein
VAKGGVWTIGDLLRWPAQARSTAVMLALAQAVGDAFACWQCPSVEALDVIKVSAIWPQHAARVALLVVLLAYCAGGLGRLRVCVLQLVSLEWPRVGQSTHRL